MTTPTPTLLTLHGSGSSGLIHTIQLARLTRLLKPHFTVHSLTAPFPSSAGPGILPFFEGCGPYYRWLPPSAHSSTTATQMRAGTSTNVLADEVVALVRGAVEDVWRRGGRVVGFVGFSQGTRVVAGLVKTREVVFGVPVPGKEKDDGEGGGGGVKGVEGEEGDRLREEFAFLRDVKFAISVCGSFPPPLVPERVLPFVDSIPILIPIPVSSTSTSASSSSLPSESPTPHPSPSNANNTNANTNTTTNENDPTNPLPPLYTRKISTPTLHIQGTQDEWEWAGKLLIGRCFDVSEANRSEVLQLNIGHHYPVLPEDSQRIADWALATWRRCEGEGPKE